MKYMKLSAWKFVRNNKKQVGVMLVAIALSFMAMYIVKFIIGSTSESFKPVMLELPKKICYIDPSSKTLGIDKADFENEQEVESAFLDKRAALVEQIKNLDGVEDAYYTQLMFAIYMGIIGNIGYEFPLMEPDKIPAFLTHMDAKLTEGRLPEGKGEILVDSVLMKNKKYKIGDSFEKESFGNTFTIVGIIESDKMVCAGTPNGYSNSGWSIVVLCEEATSDGKELLAKCGYTATEYDTIIDLASYRTFYEQDVEQVVDNSLTVVIMVIIIFLSIAVLVAYVSYLRNRVEEYCLYMSIGYGKKDIYGMIMREIGMLFGSSMIIGLIVSVVVMYFLAQGLMIPKGIVYCYWYPDFLLTIIAAYVAIIGVLQIPILFAINNIKTMDHMEE